MSSSVVSDDALFLGLMSGTSADGIDAALVRFDHDGNPQLQLGRTYAWAPQQRAVLIALGEGGDIASLDALGQLDAEVAIAFAEAALRLLDDAGVAPAAVRAIGSHGQTVRHRPLADPAFTWQLGDGNRIAELTGIATVCDFRRRDVAAGGHGAPLMPAFHAAMLGAAHEDRAVLNLGGIGNLTLLPAHGAVRGFDTGPANALLDAWCQRHRGQPYDAGGAFAASGAVDADLLQRLMADPWFALPPPKSTGREQFHLRWLEACLDTPAPTPAAVQATLLELTAATIADALLAQQPATRQLLVCGGGVHNPLLLARLQARLPGVQVHSTQAQGLDPDYIEAMGFAWLARQTLAGLPGNLPSVSGARGPRILGAIHPA
ncbi:anhydro-N-acetylmuramic acid kinase [Xanthomonas sacchari]|uniref:anhydro-N-acetylmuramic acid kinase n=1 Tax=Xanthomonas sacchari TaxID=56458 RepID=UPI00224D1643|nr:anhydro-N-acetylmuramic acid kinase [Xanthomonas sacchari]MCW0404532.1 Anhydro-N-acetylmuramic acid kinase [Xanthomonas sacchari]